MWFHMVRMTLAFVALFASSQLLWSLNAQADELGRGTFGTTWEIEEPDVREVLAEQAESQASRIKAESDAVSKELLAIFEEDKGIGLELAKELRVTKHTPVYTLPEDKYHLVRNDKGVLEWQVLFQKGTKVYPLRAMRLTSWLFIFNSNDNEQLALAEEIADFALNSGVEVKFIVSDGPLDKAIKSTQGMVYRFTKEIQQSIPVSLTPSLVGQAEADHDYLTIVSLPKPYSASIYKGYLNAK